MKTVQIPHPPAPDLLGRTWLSPTGLAQVVDFTPEGMCVVVRQPGDRRQQISPATVRAAIAAATRP
jgi:hypothetical protein